MTERVLGRHSDQPFYVIKKKKKDQGIEVTGSSLEFLVALAEKEPMFFNIN